MRVVLILPLLMMTACAGSSIERLSGLSADAPDWYEARKQEIENDPFPRPADVPRALRVGKVRYELNQSERQTLRRLEAFAADARSAGAVETPERMLRWSQRQMARFEQMDTPADFLTDRDVARLRSRFQRIPS